MLYLSPHGLFIWAAYEKGLCFSSYHLPSIPTDIYRIFILKHPLFISLSLSFSTSRSVSFSPSLCLSPDWDLQSSRLTSSGRRSRQAPQPPPTHTHTHIHKHTHSLTRHVRHEASEMRAKREICSKREEERQCAYICVCSVMHQCESMPVWICACVCVCVCVCVCLCEWGFYLGDCKSLDHL